MADPRNELADIVVPLAPVVAARASSLPLWPLAAVLVAVACMGLAFWLWRRRRPMRALNAIARAVAQRQDSPAEWAARLDAWTCERFRLLRLDAAVCPPGPDAAVWFAWVNALLHLRFAPPQPDGFDELAALCETARRWARHA
jgi:hypothetical protein